MYEYNTAQHEEKTRKLAARQERHEAKLSTASNIDGNSAQITLESSTPQEQQTVISLPTLGT